MLNLELNEGKNFKDMDTKPIRGGVAWKLQAVESKQRRQIFNDDYVAVRKFQSRRVQSRACAYKNKSKIMNTIN